MQSQSTDVMWDAHWTWTQSTKAGLRISTPPQNHTTTTIADE